MNIYKELSIHPREYEKRLDRKSVVIGGTGATGRQLIKKMLNSDSWGKVTSIGRKPVLGGEKHSKLNDIVLNSLQDMISIANEFKDHDIFFNCIGTTRSRAGSASRFIDIEVGISQQAAKLASRAQIPHASVISANGANHRQWAQDWIQPLMYIKTIGQKEQTLINNTFEKISIFRPGILIRQLDKPTLIEKLIESTGLGLKVEDLAAAMIRDAESKSESGKEAPKVYIGNGCINQSIAI